ncbi:hypothetical protein SAMN05421736_12084 [Evansella caseinilytica]|uniref:Uncharacterized protein n=1 Tax=Evansella caseinilytica TaxID=1503961 RepID=A0A1H3UEX8_9BACI|nr:hypothetical protein SAMN05421736_12084 [Evansella caseinilytica]
MDYSSKISALASEMNQLNSVMRELANSREALAHARHQLVNKKADVESDSRWIHEPQLVHELTRGTISAEHAGG